MRGCTPGLKNGQTQIVLPNTLKYTAAGWLFLKIKVVFNGAKVPLSVVIIQMRENITGGQPVAPLYMIMQRSARLFLNGALVVNFL